MEVWLGALLVGLVAFLGARGAGKWMRCVEWDSWVGSVDQDALRSHSFVPKPGHALLLSVLHIHSAMGNAANQPQESCSRLGVSSRKQEGGPAMQTRQI